MEKNKKLIVLDLDGTLLNSSKEISSRTRDCLIRLEEEGHRLLLSSGRPDSGIAYYARQLNMDEYHSYISAFNGARVVDLLSDEVIYERPLPFDLAIKVIDHLENFDVRPILYDGDYILVEDVYSGFLNIDGKKKNIFEYEARGNHLLLKEVHDFKDALNPKSIKILVSGESEYFSQHGEEIRAPFKGKLSMAYSSPFYLEFNALNVDKGAALESLLERYSISKDDVIAFGDGENDLSLLKLAGTSVAMANGTEEILKSADHITLSNEEDGIASFLEDYLI